MKLVINVPDYVKEQADDGKGEELGIPLWLAYEIANGTPHETVTEFADRCRECGREKVLDKIRAEIDRQEKWLLQTGYTAYNVDIAFFAIKSVIAESEGKE